MITDHTHKGHIDSTHFSWKPSTYHCTALHWTALCTLHTAHCTLHTAHCTLHDCQVYPCDQDGRPGWPAQLGLQDEKVQSGDCDQSGAGQEEAHLQKQVISGSQGHINYLHHRWWGQDRSRHEWAGNKAFLTRLDLISSSPSCTRGSQLTRTICEEESNTDWLFEYKTRIKLISFSLKEKCPLVGPGRVIISNLGYWQREIMYKL